ncbi:unnamed protein product [Pleuronectes platessa]|uniref:Uncharacterized protein n=1 Tax=Pleuronectes platessa TaxID=8262 RepID=A0A9N7YG89_PLEPL|nr:unnamed protein product [Pleuronectes platessa]
MTKTNTVAKWQSGKVELAVQPGEEILQLAGGEAGEYRHTQQPRFTAAEIQLQSITTASLSLGPYERVTHPGQTSGRGVQSEKQETDLGGLHLFFSCRSLPCESDVIAPYLTSPLSLSSRAQSTGAMSPH